MKRVFEKIVNYIIAKRQLKLMKTLDKIKKMSSAVDMSQNYTDENLALSLNSEKQKKQQTIEAEIKNIILKNKENPNALLDFVKNHCCKIYQHKYLDKLSNLFQEEIGFVAPFSGVKAFLFSLLLNLISEKKFVFWYKTKPMFVFADKNVNKHLLYHHFYKWYSYNSGQVGFDEKAQKLFKEHTNSKKQKPIEKLKIEEIISLKEAIARDKEAADFVIQLAKETDGAKNALNKIITDGGANL